MVIKVKEFVGNIELLKLKKTAFFCSRKITSSAVLKCYDWAIIQRESGNCVISGFHSQIEKDILYYLVKGTQPIILTLARGIKKRFEPYIKDRIDKGNFLIITPFEKSVNRVTEKTAEVRNKLMINLADQIVIGYINPKGKISKLIEQTNKQITYLS